MFQTQQIDMSENNPAAMTIRNSRFVNVGGGENVINYHAHAHYNNCTVNHHHPHTRTIRIIHELRAPPHVTHMPVDLNGAKRKYVNEGEGHMLVEEVEVRTLPSLTSAEPRRQHQGNMLAGGEETEAKIVSRRRGLKRKRLQSPAEEGSLEGSSSAAAAAAAPAPAPATTTAAADTVTLSKTGADSVRILDMDGRGLQPGDLIQIGKRYHNEVFVIYVGDGYIVKRDDTTSLIVKEKLDVLQPFYKKQLYVLPVYLSNKRLLPAEERVRRAEGRVGQVIERDNHRFMKCCYYG